MYGLLQKIYQKNSDDKTILHKNEKQKKNKQKVPVRQKFKVRQVLFACEEFNDILPYKIMQWFPDLNGHQ